MLTILKLLKSDRDVELSISNGVTPRWNSKKKSRKNTRTTILENHQITKAKRKNENKTEKSVFSEIITKNNSAEFKEMSSTTKVIILKLFPFPFTKDKDGSVDKGEG